LEQAQAITYARIQSWQYYYQQFSELELAGLLRRPVVPTECQHNAHMYYVLLSSELDRQQVLDSMKQQGVHAVFHYVPLHSSAAGRRFGRVHGDMQVTDTLPQALIRLPLWCGISEPQQQVVVSALTRAIGR
jgi:dTDP-4-amino-4,6-dideoxygalactose transaminase